MACRAPCSAPRRRSASRARGQQVHSGCSPAQACSTASTVANFASRSSVRMVGKIMKKLPALCRASASAGRTHTGSNCSASSATGVWPAGMRATRNGTSKRRGRSRSVIQCASTIDLVRRQRQSARAALRGEGRGARSSAAMSCAPAGRPSAWRASRTPSSSKLSRIAAIACVRRRSLCVGRRAAVSWACASAASMPPPGNTYAPGRKAGGSRAPRHQHLDALRAVSRSSRTVAAGRGAAGSRCGCRSWEARTMPRIIGKRQAAENPSIRRLVLLRMRRYSRFSAEVNMKIKHWLAASAC